MTKEKGAEMFESGFDRFWRMWPVSTRKGGKSQCMKIWEKNYLESCCDSILKHVEWMKTTDQWRKSNGAFIPAPSVYLNQQRWDGAEVPEVAPKEAVDPFFKKYEEDKKKAVPMPEDVKRKLLELRRGV